MGALLSGFWVSFGKLVEAGFGAQSKQKRTLRDRARDRNACLLTEPIEPAKVDITGQIAFTRGGEWIDLLSLLIGTQRIARCAVRWPVVDQERSASCLGEEVRKTVGERL